MFVNPIEILNLLELRKDMKAADFGSGSGGWAIPLAQKLIDGTVFAIDVQESPLSALLSRAHLAGVSNIKTVLADVESPVPGIEDNTLDLALITDLLFQTEEPKAVFQEVKRALKVGGNVLVVEWNVDAMLGPRSNKLSKEQVKEIAEDLGFVLDKEVVAGDYHYALILSKK